MERMVCVVSRIKSNSFQWLANIAHLTVQPLKIRLHSTAVIGVLRLITTAKTNVHFMFKKKKSNVISQITGAKKFRTRKTKS